MKKLLSLVLVLTMVFALAAPVFAESYSDALTGMTVQVETGIPNTTYNIYQILKLETYSVTAGAYRYVKGASLGSMTTAEFLALSAEVDGTTKTLGTYIGLDEGAKDPNTTTDYFYWKNNAETGKPEVADAQVVAQILKAAVEAGKITAAASPVTSTGSASESAKQTLQWENLAAGYYLVDSGAGVLCGMDTAKKEGDSLVVTIKEKNSIPTIDKKVQDDDEAGTWIDSKDDDADDKRSDAEVGDVINFQTTIHATKGAENYVLHDKMSAGLTFQPGTVVVKDNTKTLDAGTDYTLVTAADVDSEGHKVLTDDCTFEIRFSETYLDAKFGQTTSADADIVVTYSARLNENAVEDVPEKNDTVLDYGDDHHTEHDHTDTYTYNFNLHKDGFNVNTNETASLAGAEFKLYHDVDCTNFVKMKDLGNAKYQVVSDTGVEVTMVTPANGNVAITGLNEGTYYLKETKAPAGYNVMDEIIKVVVDNNGNITMSEVGTTDTVAYENDSVTIVNRTGNELPSTGGIGTTIFYVVGLVLMAGAAILLITKKRMSASEN